MFVLHVLDEPLQTPVLVGDLFVWRPADFDTQHKFQPDLRITTLGLAGQRSTSQCYGDGDTSDHLSTLR